MKKILNILLALVMVLSISGIAFAGPFNDVPAKHWAYDAVNLLIKDGLIDGYPDSTFRGDKPISRYEMAQLVDKALHNEAKATVEQKALIDKLASEFALELNNLDTRVAKLEKTSPSLKIDAWDRQRYQQNDGLSGYKNGPNGASASSRYRMTNDFKLLLSSQVNDNIDFVGNSYYRLQQSDAGTNDPTREGAFCFYNLYMHIKDIMPSADLYMGRIHVQVSNGMMFGGDYFDGAQVNYDFGSGVKAFVGYGDYTYMPGPDYIGTAYTQGTNYPAKAKIAGLSVPFGSSTTFYLGYFGSANNTPLSDTAALASGIAPVPSIRFNDYDLGFSTTIAPKLVWSAEYAKNNDGSVSQFANGDKTAWMTSLQYGTVDKTAVGSNDVWVKYFKRGADAVDWRGSFTQFEPTFLLKTDVEGPTIGYDLTIYKNVVLNLQYAKYRQYSTSTNSGNISYQPFVQAQVAFWF